MGDAGVEIDESRLRQPKSGARDALLLRGRGKARRARVRGAGGRGAGRRRWWSSGSSTWRCRRSSCRARGRRWRRSRRRFWGDPTAELKVIGVTGTNGKTTTAYLAREILEAAGIQTGLMGTVKQVVGGVEEPVERTTPEAIDLQETFRRMIDGGDRAVRDGGVLARDGPAPRRRDPLRRRGLHQPDPGPPRLPRRRWRSTSRPSGCSSRPTRGCGSSTSTTPTAAASPRNSSAVTFSAEGADADYRATDVEFDATGASLHGAIRPDEASCDVKVGCRGTSTSPTRSGRSRRRGRSGSTPRRRPPALAACGAGAGALRADRRGPGLRRPRRLRPHAGLARERAAGGAAADAGQADLGLRRRRRPRPRQAAADGPGAAAPRRPRRSSPPTTRAPRTPRRSSPKSPPGRARATPSCRSRSTAAPRSRCALGRAQPGDTVVIAGKGHEQGQEFEGGRKIPFDDRTVAREELRKLGSPA